MAPRVLHQPAYGTPAAAPITDKLPEISLLSHPSLQPED